MVLNSDTISFLRHSVQIKFQKEQRGYSKEQVQRTLAKLPPLADEIERLQNKLEEYEARAQAAESRLIEAQTPSDFEAPQMPTVSQDFDETLRNTLVSAQRTADTTIREAQEEAERLRSEAELQTNSLLAEANEKAGELQAAAEQTHADLVSEAEAERTSLLKSASKEVGERKKEIEKELAEAHEVERTSLLNQISELQETHNLLQGDVTRFEDHLKARQEEVKKALSEITVVLDDPEKLRVEDPIVAAEVPEFQAEDYPPIGIELDSINELEQEVSVVSDAEPEVDEFLDLEDVDSLELFEDGLSLEDASGTETELLEAEPLHNFEVSDSIVEAEFEENIEFESQELDRVVPPPPPASGDPYLEELRRVTTEEPTDGDPIANFLDDDDDKSSGWFGRKK